MRRTALVLMLLVAACGRTLDSGDTPARRCATEAATFETASAAYKAINNVRPPGATAAAVAAVLAANGPDGQLLSSARLTYNDANTPPASGHWYYNATTGHAINGAGCRSS